MQLNKYLAHAGISSRRKSVELIRQGLVTVNNGKVYEPGHFVKTTDVVRINKKTVNPQTNLYILLNKPRGYITTTSDENGRSTVMDLLDTIPNKQRLYPVGRLDRDTTGLLLMTNDGTLTQRLAHPRYEVSKTYIVTIDSPFNSADYAPLKNGIALDDGEVMVDSVLCLNQSKTRLKVCLHSGKNRVIRRIFARLGYNVLKLDRVSFAQIVKKDLPVGRWRYLTDKEIERLKGIGLNKAVDE